MSIAKSHRTEVCPHCRWAGCVTKAEVRGHRRTYIGALPGQIIQMMKKAGTQEPGLHAGRKSTRCPWISAAIRQPALLEVLDPEQNFMFVDHYLDVEYDLSQVFFIATANVMHTISSRVARPDGSAASARLHRAGKGRNRQAISGQEAVCSRAGLTDKNLKFSDDAITSLIRSYTREAGVRNLEREIGNVCRKVRAQKW